MKKNNNSCRTMILISKIYKIITEGEEKKNTLSVTTTVKRMKRKKKETEATRNSKTTMINLEYFKQMVDFMNFLFCCT